MSTVATLDKALSSITKSNLYNYGMPPQTVSVGEKETDEWKRSCMNFIVNEARSHSIATVRDLKKYQMLSDDYDYSDNHNWSLDPLNLGDQKDEMYGATDPIQHYPIVNTPLNTILGERISRTTQWLVVSDSPESQNEYYRQKEEMLFEDVQNSINGTILREIVANAQQTGVEMNEQFLQQAQQQAQQMMPESIEEYMNNTYTDKIEKIHNRILKNIVRTNDLETEFIEGFRHGTICGKEFYSFDVVNNKLVVKNLSPFSVFFLKSPSKRWVSESQVAGYRLFLTLSSIIDIFRDKLTVENVEALEKKLSPTGISGGHNSVTGIKSIGYQTNVFSDWHGNTYDNVNWGVLDGMINEFMLTGQRVFNRNAQGLFEIVQGYWKSYRKVGFLEKFVGDDEPIETLVDENYEPVVEEGEHVKWFYLNQVYQGTSIADDCIVDVGPYPFQIFDENNPDYSPLPIEGAEYNNFNGKSMSLMDLMLPWAELYDIVANELKKDLKKAMGKVMFMSVDHIPDIEGFDMNKWMYWCKEFGIAWVGAGKKNSTFSHFSAQDMSFAEQITAKMNMLDKIKMNCDAFGGFSQPRVAGTNSAPTQGQDQQKLIASANQTEYYFWKHGKICERVLTQGLNIEKALIRRKKNKIILYDDLEQRYIDAGEIDSAIAENVNLFVINSTQELNKREALRQMASVAAGKTGSPEDMGDIMMADTQNEIKKILRAIGKKSAAAAQSQQQLEQQIAEAEIKDKQEDRAWEKEKHYSGLASEERQEYMRTFGGRNASPNDDTDGDGTPNVLEFQEHFENVANNQRNYQLQSKKIDNDLKTKEKELALKKEDINVKKQKNQIDLKNQANDLAIEKERSRNRGSKK